MGSLSGFRPPQFSEDVNWLPAWLQPHEFNEHITEGKSKSEPTFKALHFHLHLSSDNYSENMRSPLMEMSLAEISESNNAMLMQHIGTSAVPDEKANQFKCEMSQNPGLVNVAPSLLQEKSDKLGPQYFSNNLDSGMKHEDNVRLLKVADISDAIELSVAASEALLIHEVIESGSTKKSLSASAILEVALRLKQARLEGFKEAALNFSHEETSDIDCLSDLDESTMADAYEEIGLSISAVAQRDCDSVISQVKDTYAMENYGSDEKFIYEERGTLGVDSADIFTKQKSKDVKSYGIQSKEDLALESFDSDRRKKLIDDLAQGLETSSVAVDVNSMLNCSIQENPDISSTTKKFDFAMEEVALFQETVKSSPQARISENAERYDLTYTTPNKFQSRWLGGWTRKNEGNASAAMECNGAGHIPEYFAGETSLLSESAEIAPDENSFMQNQDERSGIVSQSSVPSKGLCTKNTDEMFLYEDAVNSSSPSIVDPLCSVVPCSISSENACSTLAHNQNGKADTGKCFSSIPEHKENNLQRSSSLDMEFVNGQGLTVQETDAEGSQVIVCRQVTSLRTYSMLLPSHGAYLGKESNYCDQSFPLECNENMLYSVVESPITNSTDKPRNYDESTKDEAELHIHMQKEMGSPGTKCIFQASKSFLHDIGGEENPEHTAVLERDAGLLKVKNLQIADSHNIKAPGRKRVRFAEAKISFPQNKLQTLQTTYTNCFTRRGSRFKSFNPYPQEWIRCPKKYLDKSSRRLIFQNIEFLLAGFSGKKEKEIEGLIRKYGGVVLSDIPSPPSSRAWRSTRFRRQPIPVILCFKKLQTIKFLYGCAVKACMLTVNWLTDSISAGSVLPPEKYSILPNHGGEMCSRMGKPALCNRYIFDNVGIMLHGKPNFCTKMAKVVKHGGGLVFKTLQWLVQSLEDEKISVGAIITEDVSRVSRHLKHCASEWKIPLMPDNWIINSLYAGKLLPFVKNNHLAPSHRIKLLDIPVSVEMSEEI